MIFEGSNYNNFETEYLHILFFFFNCFIVLLSSFIYFSAVELLLLNVFIVSRQKKYIVQPYQSILKCFRTSEDAIVKLQA